jgi:hypothetical protein
LTVIPNKWTEVSPDLQILCANAQKGAVMMLQKDHLIRKPLAGISNLLAAVWSPLYVSPSSVLSLTEGYRGFGCGAFPMKAREFLGDSNYAQYFSDRQRAEWTFLQFTA